MANSILNQSNTQPQAPRGQAAQPNMMQQIMEFGRNFQGDPKQQVMQMVQSGARTNEQLQQAMNMARQLQGMFR